jgi:general secretion pathway protein D
MNTMTFSYIRMLSTIVAVLTIAACSSHLTRGDNYAQQNAWGDALREYQEAQRKDPGNIEITSKLKQTEIKAADYYYHKGMLAQSKGDNENAMEQFQLGLIAMPANDKLAKALQDVINRKEANSLYKESLGLLDAGRRNEAKVTLLKALELYPDYRDAVSKLSEIQQIEQVQDEQQLALSSSRPITLNFKETDIRDAYEFLTKSFGVNVIFDDSVKNTPVTLYANDVTFTQGLSLLLATSKTFYRKIGPNTILVAMDSKDKRGQYEDLVVKNFVLNTIRAKEMADLIKGVIAVKKLVVNETLNSISVRDSADIVKLVDRMVYNNDRKEAEVILDVEILEINRNKAEKLGLDFGSYSVSTKVPELPVTSSFQDVKDAATMALPSLTLNFLKKDVDARILANPRIRVLNNKSAKIHIGDRVPLIATTIQDATGQVRNTFDYKDIGIRLTAEPTVHLDTSVTVKLGLEVSSLGANLGTVEQPAYSIGSRNAETTMLLRDGETAVLGGLIQDSERNTHLRVPGIGDIPAVGTLFTSHNDSTDRTDVLLTITPRVVRGWDLPPVAERQFYSGTENSYYDKQLFADLKQTAVTPSGNAVAPTIETSGSIQNVTSTAPSIVATSFASSNSSQQQTASVNESQGALGFSKPVYDIDNGAEFTIQLTGESLGGLPKSPITILYNPKVISFVSGEPGATTS